ATKIHGRTRVNPSLTTEAGTQGPRTRPKNWVPASAGTNGIERRFKLSSSRSSRLYVAAAIAANAARNSKSKNATGYIEKWQRKQCAPSAPFSFQSSTRLIRRAGL